jgi:hypothetical protein
LGRILSHLPLEVVRLKAVLGAPLHLGRTASPAPMPTRTCEGLRTVRFREMTASPYLSELGQDRERVAVVRWCFGHFGELLAAAGLRRGWWFGFGLDRHDVFGVGQGDVDIVAGPIALTWSPKELKAITREQAAKYPGYKGSWLKSLVLLRAGELGFIEWPPRIGFVAAIEVKASYFDGQTWKRTHENEQDEIRGQINFLHAQGVNCVNFLHLASTTPAGEIGRSWQPAADVIDLAYRTGFPTAFEPDGRTGVFRGFMAAIPEGTEDMDGLHDGLTTISPSAPAPVERKVWHDRLHRRLAELPKPSYFRTCILPCKECRLWRLARGPLAENHPCACKLGRPTGKTPT